MYAGLNDISKSPAQANGHTAIFALLTASPLAYSLAPSPPRDDHATWYSAVVDATLRLSPLAVDLAAADAILASVPPADKADVLPALQSMAAEPGTSAVVRPAWNDPVLIKRLLDFGAHTLLIPYVQSAEDAPPAVAATRYPPVGMRGVAGLHRATRYGRIGDYMARAHEETCVLVQVETRAALDRLEEIAQVEGIDGVFIGPADLAARRGHPGRQDHPEVVEAIMGAIDRLGAIGVPAGILTLDAEFARACMARGTRFTAVGIDASLLLDGAR